jgi:hypothetical protein
MVPEVMASVCGYQRPGRPALLCDHRCRLVRGEVYPAVIGYPGDQVSGLLYEAVTDHEAALLDTFEGEMYRRRGVDVLLGDCGVGAQTYILADTYRDSLSEEPWSLERFVADGIDRFVADYAGFVRTAAGALAQ